MFRASPIAQFSESADAPGGHRGLLMLLVVGDQHDRDAAELRVRLDRLGHFDPVAVIAVELAVDGDQVDLSLSQHRERVFDAVRLDDCGAEGRVCHLTNGVEIGTAVAAVKKGLGHG